MFTVEFIYKLEQLVPVCFVEGVNWEIFWNNPWMSNRIRSNEIHPMSMGPHTMLVEAKGIFCCSASALALVSFLPSRIHLFCCIFHEESHIFGALGECDEHYQGDEEENKHQNHKWNEST